MKVYAGTYHKYNCGSLEGQWLNLDLFSSKEEFMLACYELHADEDDPEIMFQDFETENDCERQLYGESYISCEYWEIKEELQNIGIADEVFSAWASGEDETLTAKSVGQCYAQYEGQWDNLIDYVSNWYEEKGEIKKVPEALRGYIDFESIAKDWQFDGDVSIHNGYVFSR